MIPTDTQAWAQLADLALAQNAQASDPNATQHFTLGGCHFDFSHQRTNVEVLSTLKALNEELALPAARDAMLTGELINNTEQRAVLHTALRDGAQIPFGEEVAAARERMLGLAEAIRNGSFKGHTGRRITDVVHIGIGGSHLGPELVVRALAGQGLPRLHFVANIDPRDLYSTLADLDATTTLFIIASKSFSTLETQQNAMSARSWFLERTASLEAIPHHFLAISNNIEAAAKFGIPEANLLAMPEWVGGRFSLWSAIGLPIAIALGRTGFEEMLDGARIADEHFASAPLDQNIPVISANLALWNFNFLGARSLAVLCYDQRLEYLPHYLQQLEMESNGKSVDKDGNKVGYHTMPVLWGGLGTQGQHAYHQHLHQGTHAYAADFVCVSKRLGKHLEGPAQDHQNWLLANALGQSEAMSLGQQEASSQHQIVGGKRPHSVIILDELTPRNLGTLLAVYEHKVFCLGVMWHINSFDQWGVELGKRLAIPIYDRLAGRSTEVADFAPTEKLIAHLKAMQNSSA